MTLLEISMSWNLARPSWKNAHWSGSSWLNRQACLELVAALGSTRLSSRDLGILYAAYQTGHWLTRQRLLKAPLVFLKSYKEVRAASAVEPGPSDSLLTDLGILSATARHELACSRPWRACRADRDRWVRSSLARLATASCLGSVP
jgi:hypothetical protein